MKLPFGMLDHISHNLLAAQNPLEYSTESLLGITSAAPCTPARLARGFKPTSPSDVSNWMRRSDI